jgi:hypothetical protein
LASAVQVSVSVVGVLPLVAAKLMSVGVASTLAAAMSVYLVVKSQVVKLTLVAAGLGTVAALTKHKGAGLVWVLRLH